LKELYPNVNAVENKPKKAKEKGYSWGYIKVLGNLKNIGKNENNYDYY